MRVPQAVPSCAFVAEQAGALVDDAHVKTPVLQVAAGVKVHGPPPEQVHAPLQVCPVAHLVPHAPQLETSVRRLLHVPLQFDCPELQQIPFEQVCPDVQAKPHAPQLVGSLGSETHLPLHAVVPELQVRQSVPAGLHPLAHVPVAAAAQVPAPSQC
jgi:hypothetical protein